MQQKRIQNRIAESRWTQAYVVSAAALVWVIAGIYNPLSNSTRYMPFAVYLSYDGAE